MLFKDLSTDVQAKAFFLYIDQFIVEDDYTFFDFKAEAIRGNWEFVSDGSLTWEFYKKVACEQV